MERFTSTTPLIMTVQYGEAFGRKIKWESPITAKVVFADDVNTAGEAGIQLDDGGWGYAGFIEKKGIYTRYAEDAEAGEYGEHVLRILKKEDFKGSEWAYTLSAHGKEDYSRFSLGKIEPFYRCELMALVGADKPYPLDVAKLILERAFPQRDSPKLAKHYPNRREHLVVEVPIEGRPEIIRIYRFSKVPIEGRPGICRFSEPTPVLHDVRAKKAV